MRTYVIQTRVGREQSACDRVSRHMRDRGVRAYVPCTEVAKRWGGVWHRVTKPAFPGYAFVGVPGGAGCQGDIDELRGIARVLGVGSEPVALSEDEERFFEGMFEPDGDGGRLMRMSRGVIEGDRVVVLEGPLQGHEERVVKVDRHKRMAFLEVQILGRRKVVKVSLEIVERRP